MKIGLDLRSIKKGDKYSNFVFKIIQILINSKQEVEFKIYLDLPFAHLNFGQNTKNKIITAKAGSIQEQTKFCKTLKDDKNDLVIFFNYQKPLNYKKAYIIFLGNLVEFHYPPKKHILKKYFDNYLLNKNSTNAKKVICFNEITKNEINDKLNIFEDNINVLQAFFNKKKLICENEINLDIKTKYNIKGNYFLYTAGAGTHKNLDRLIEVFYKYKQNNVDLSLVILDKTTVQDISLRKKIIDNHLQDKIYFIGEVEDQEKTEFYKNSMGVIFSSLYESFPFDFEDAMNFGAKIIASDIKNIKEVFGDTIEYFPPTNTSQMYDKILKFSKSKKKANYDEIFEKYNISRSSKQFLNIINSL